MQKILKKYLVVAVLTTGMGSLVGCNTASKMIKHGNLEVSNENNECSKENQSEI